MRTLLHLSPTYAKAALVGVFITSLSPAARAQGDAGSRALAVQLFDEAEVLFAKNRVAEACPKYAESYRLDPQLGVLVYLAECYEKNAQLASAWGTFREAEEIARKRGDARGEHARERATALEQRLSYIVIDVPESARLPGLQVLRDGAPVPEVLWGGRAAIDSGKHRIEVSAAGYKPWRSEVVIAPEPGARTITVPKLQADSSTAAGSAAKPVDANPGTSQRMAALAVGGLGVVGLSAGGFFGLSAQASLSDSKNLCSEKNFCTPAGKELRSSAKSKALVATISTGVGVAALATATVLWFTAPKSEVSGPRRGAWSLAPTRSAWGLEMTRDF